MNPEVAQQLGLGDITGGYLPESKEMAKNVMLFLKQWRQNEVSAHQIESGLRLESGQPQTELRKVITKLQELGVLKKGSKPAHYAIDKAKLSKVKVK